MYVTSPELAIRNGKPRDIVTIGHTRNRKNTNKTQHSAEN